MGLEGQVSKYLDPKIRSTLCGWGAALELGER